ncbi:hypothetical protein [Dactylosporangium sp. NPDC051541]|uniref:hypothetical protein n=1 Tax=Dactylosporangium sp. NPDC051541 TaxID=3363977 RepID=UPI00378A9A00
MTDAVTRRWQEADDAVESLIAALTAAVVRAEERSRKRPRGRRPKRQSKSTRRYLAEVIRSRRLAPGLTVDRNMIAALFTGHRELIGNPVLVAAVAEACGIIAGRKLSAKELERFRDASRRTARLIARAQAAGPAAETPKPDPVPPPATVVARAAIPAPAPPPAAEHIPAPVDMPAPVDTPTREMRVLRPRRRRRSYWWVIAFTVLVVLVIVFWLTR